MIAHFISHEERRGHRRNSKISVVVVMVVQNGRGRCLGRVYVVVSEGKRKSQKVLAVRGGSGRIFIMNRIKMTMSTTKMTAKTSSGHMRNLLVIALNELFNGCYPRCTQSCGHHER
jgi:hypothetical protein